MSASMDAVIVTSGPYDVPRVVAGVVIPTAANTSTPLGAGFPLTVGLTITALSGNSGVVYIGGESSGSAGGYPLAKGVSVFVPCSRLDQVAVSAATSGDGIAYIGG